MIDQLGVTHMKILRIFMLFILTHVHGHCTFDWHKGCSPEITSVEVNLSN